MAKLKSKLSQNQFYCVKCGKRVSLPHDEIRVKMLKNYKRKGGVPSVRGKCHSCSTVVSKFIKKSNVNKFK